VDDHQHRHRNLVRFVQLPMPKTGTHIA
jgi:hypothetical protein